MNSTTRKLYSPRLLDVAFALIGVACVIIFAVDIPAAESGMPAPLWQGAMLVGGAIAIAFLVCKLSAIDRRCSDDYVYQTLALSAVTGMVTMLIGHALWDFEFLLGQFLPEPQSGDMVLLGLAGWAFGYLYYRMKGTVA